MEVLRLPVDDQVGQPHLLGHPRHALVAPQVVQEPVVGRQAALEREPVRGGRRQESGLAVGEQVHVGTDDRRPAQPEGQDAQRF